MNQAHSERLHPRDAERLDIRLDAELRCPDWPELPIVLVDISPVGFRCTAEIVLEIGCRVVLRIPRLGQFPATIAWQLGREAGARFDSPLAKQIVFSLMARAAGAAN